jgi:O-antigen/teichoic acid export membrane protein
VAQNVVDHRVWSNSASGYIRSAFRLALGVISFRVACTELSTEELGFYGLVWSFLGYGVLLDLGMGVAVQKRTAELHHRKDWNQLGRMLSSVLCCNCICAAVIVTVGFLATDPLLRAVGVSPANLARFCLAFRVFVVGMAAIFPLEMFREVHCGQQRIAFTDHVSTIGGVISVVGLILALRMHWGLPAILGIQITCMVVTGVVIARSALRAMPEVRLGMRFVSWSALRSIAMFSALAYLVVFAGVIVLQTDRFLVGAVLSVSAVATYHVGAKVPEIFTAFTRQLPGALAPAAAALHEAGQRASWQRLFVRGIRFNALVMTPLFLLCALFFEGFVAFFTRGRFNGSDVTFLGELLLVWSYSMTLTHGISKAVFLMSGHESRLVRLVVVEALANITLSCVLLKWLKSPVGAALGSLVPALMIGWCFLWPWAAREVGTTAAKLARDTLLPALRASGLLLAFGTMCRIIPVLDFRASLPVFLIEATVASVLAAAGTWHFGLTVDERAALVAKFDGARSRVRSA